MKFKAKIIEPLNILHLSFEDAIDMTLSLLRPQEFYESPKFRGKYFTLEDYIYFSCHDGKEYRPFDYLVEVGGHNIPGLSFREWQHLVGDDRLSEREFCIVDQTYKYFPRDHNFYIIATTKTVPNLEGYLAHEIRHAMFYLIPEYRDDIMSVIKRHPTKRLRKKLEEDYHRKVVDDEVHAYALTGFDPYYCGKISELPRELQNLRKDLKKVERKYIKKGKIYVPGQ